MKPLTTTAYHSPALRPGDGAENADDTTPAAIDPASLANAITEDDTHGPYNTTGHMPVIRPADGAENVLTIRGLASGVPMSRYPGRDE